MLGPTSGMPRHAWLYAVLRVKARGSCLLGTNPTYRGTALALERDRCKKSSRAGEMGVDMIVTEAF